MNRRHFITHSGKTVGIAAAIATIAPRLHAADAAAPGLSIQHSVCRWCYGSFPLDALCAAAKEIGLTSIELTMPPDFPTLRRYGLTCAIAFNPVANTSNGVPVGGIERAFNRLEHHDALVAAYETHLKSCKQFGVNQVICFSGNRAGQSDEQGLENCAIGLKRILPLAEKLGITLVMELLNSKVDHRDYQCDKTAWGVELCKRIDSPNFKLLYDIYHMQIMEGDLIATIRANHSHFAHYHTGGVPGRNEIDDTQEIHYPAVIRAIVETGYKGYVGQEFIPKRTDRLASLSQGVKICSV